MGLGIGKPSSCSCGSSHEPPPPLGELKEQFQARLQKEVNLKKIAEDRAINPRVFEILDVYYLQGIPEWIAVKVKYPSAKNYEGVKVMVFKASLIDMMNAKFLDPHFCEGDHLSPVARFQPTDEGWVDAINYIQGKVQGKK